MFKSLFINADGTHNWLVYILALLAIVILPGLLTGRLTTLWAGILVSAVVLVITSVVVFVWASAVLKGLS